MSIRRLVLFAVLVPALGLGLAACEAHTVRLEFSPAVGDEFRYRSHIEQSVRTSLDDAVTETEEAAELVATHRITGVGDEITASVTVVRDGTAPRTFDARVDRTSRLAGIDLVEGVPAAALGIDVATTVPADLYRPPAGEVAPGTRWMIRRDFELPDADEPVAVVGYGRITHLDVEEGVEVVVAVVELRVPVQSQIDTADGRVTLHGVQHTRSETAYDLASGALHRDHTDVSGSLAVIVEPPPGLDVPPVHGSLDYDVETVTRRSR